MVPREIKRLNKLVTLLLSGLLLSGAVHGAGETTPMIRCIEKERLALLEFKRGLIDEYNMLSSWGSEEDAKRECCEWYGIVCSNTTNQVIAIKLHEAYLSGKISPSLVGLKHLIHLDLSVNRFEGRVPKFLGDFRRLKYLSLAAAGFSGEIPPQLGNLTNLWALDLSSNFHLTIKTRGWLSNLSYLEYLDMSSVDLSMNPDWLQEILNLHFLQELYLRNCHQNHPSNAAPSSVIANSSLPFLSTLDLGGFEDLTFYNYLSSSIKSVWPFNSSIMHLWPFNITMNLVSLGLSSNNIAGPINAAIGELQHLEHLDLNGNSIEGVNMECLGNLSRLQLLDLSDNALRVPLFQVIDQLRGSEKSLETLQLDRSELNGSIPDLSRFSSLTKLDLSNNYLGGPFPNGVELPSKLVYLDLSNNTISGHFPADMAVLSSLKEFRVQQNRIRGSVPQSIGKLSQLETLDLSSNLLDGVVSEKHFSNLSSLKDLYLSFNSISLNINSDWIPPFQLFRIGLINCKVGPSFPSWLLTQNDIMGITLPSAGISGPLPDRFWNISRPNWYYLDLSYNNISGSIPNSLGSSFPNMTGLDISSNKFSGAIPSLLPPNLDILYLTDNNFTGSILPLCGISFLRVLDLSDNALSGGIPDCLLEKNNFAYINLANNNFSGRVPNLFGPHNNLVSLRLENNSFTGKVPSSLKNCSLMIMDLGENMFSGMIPAWLGMQPLLTMLRLQFNHFYGKIPSSLCQLSNILVLDLSHNNLSGTIPGCFSNLSSLAPVDNYSRPPQTLIWYASVPGIGGPTAVLQWKRQEHEFTSVFYQRMIDLSSNQLAGEIPQAIACLKGLRALNLSRNHLSGTIIWGFGQMEMLESLDLSRNQLFGEIPIDFSNLTKLSVLDLSYNNLSGKIPSSTQLQSFDASSYAGNAFLCGYPLSKCSGDDDSNYDPSHTLDKDGSIIGEEDSFVSTGFYISIPLGFVVGFWGVVGPIFFNRRWRITYFLLLSGPVNWLYETTIVLTARARGVFYR